MAQAGRVVLRVSPEAVASTSLEWAVAYAEWHPHVKYLLQPGGEHYKLLACLAEQLEGATICDVGTFIGNSALALAAGAERRDNAVVSYDVRDCVQQELRDRQQRAMAPKTVLDHPRVRRELVDLTAPGAEAALQAVAAARLVVVDTDSPAQQRDLIFALAARGFRGVLVLDDIHLNDDMKAVWQAVPAAKKLDLTDVGHWSGTGVAVFDPSWLDVELELPVPQSAFGAGGRLL